MQRESHMVPRCGVSAGGRRGFTLVELLVTMGLLSILLYVVAYSFATTQKAFSMMNNSLQAHQEARAALDMLAAELAAARTTSYYDAAETDPALRRKTIGLRAFEENTTATRDGRSMIIHRQTISFLTTAFQAGGNPAGSGARSPQLVDVTYEHSFPLSTPPAPPALPDFNELRTASDDERLLTKRIHWVDWRDYGSATYDADHDNPDLIPVLGEAEGAGFDDIFFALRFFDPDPAPVAGVPSRPRWTCDQDTNSDGIIDVYAGTWDKPYLPSAVEITLVVRPRDARAEYPFVRVTHLPQAEYR